MNVATSPQNAIEIGNQVFGNPVPKAVEDALAAAEAEQAALMAEQAEATPPPVAEEPKTPEPLPTPTVSQSDLDALSHKFDVLQGKYKAEVPRLAEQLREKNDEIARMKSQATNASSAKDLKAMTDDDFKKAYGFSDEHMEYGRPVLEAQILVAKMEAQKAYQPLQEELQQTRHAQRVTQFNADITSGVPDWVVINSDPRFLSWLGSNPEQQELLDEASETWSPKKAINVFRLFKAENPSSTAPQVKVPIAAQVMPRQGAAHAEPTGQPQINPKYDTEEKIYAAYVEFNKGYGDPRLRAQLEKELDVAERLLRQRQFAGKT